MKKLIITADDYGMSPAVNQAIDEGIEAGLITATNVMTNMPFYTEAKKLKDNPNISVGLHWVLATGTPVLPPEEIPTLVTTNSTFYPYPEFRNRLRNHKISYEDIKKELVAQYVKFRDLIGEPDYWNTHQNTHVDFGIYALVVDIARELGICKMRSHQRIYVPASGKHQTQPLVWRVIEPMKAQLLNVWQNNAHKKGVASTQGLVVCLNEDDADKPEYVFSNINWKDNNIAEFVIHPAVTNDSPYFGRIVDKRIQQYKLFTSPETYKCISDSGLSLATYNDIT